MDPEQPGQVYTNGHSTVVDDEHFQQTDQSTIDKQNLDPVCKQNCCFVCFFIYFVLYL